MASANRIPATMQAAEEPMPRAVSYTHLGIYVEGRSPAHTWESVDDYREQYDHPLWKRYLQEGVKAGHDGMDYLRCV